MRAVLIGDLVTAARVLMRLPPEDRPGAMELMLEQAHAAHRFAKRTGRPLTRWGNGSLMGRATREERVAMPHASELAFLEALQIVITVLLAWKGRGSAGRGSGSTVRCPRDVVEGPASRRNGHGRNQTTDGSDRPRLAEGLR